MRRVGLLNVPESVSSGEILAYAKQFLSGYGVVVCKEPIPELAEVPWGECSPARVWWVTVLETSGEHIPLEACPSLIFPEIS